MIFKSIMNNKYALDAYGQHQCGIKDTCQTVFISFCKFKQIYEAQQQLKTVI